MTSPKTLRLSLLSIAAAALMAACGGGSDDDHAHEDTFLDTAGRLAITQHDARDVRVHDLDSPAAAVQATYTMDHVPSQIYTSPQSRYAVVVQRLNDQVQFIDGGIWQEDHGSHEHDYKQGSRLMSWKLTGSRPTHYDVQAGKQAAFFMDGNASATPAQNAGVRVFDDAGIARASNQLLASLDLNLPIHGIGEPVDNKLLTVSRADDAPDTLPTHLELYLRNGTGFNYARQIPTRCNGMHGSFSSGNHTATGCLDGMLLVRHITATDVDNGQKLLTPVRIGTIAGHPKLPDRFFGIGNQGSNAAPPVTTRFFAVDATGNAARVNEVVPQGWEAGRVRRAHAFDRSGQRFYILDNEGALTVMQHQADSGWTTAARIPAFVPNMPTAAPWPVIVANGAKDEIYMTDPLASQLIVASAVNGTVAARHALNYVPSGAAWVGIKR